MRVAFIVVPSNWTGFYEEYSWSAIQWMIHGVEA